MKFLMSVGFIESYNHVGWKESSRSSTLRSREGILSLVLQMLFVNEWSFAPGLTQVEKSKLFLKCYWAGLPHVCRLCLRILCSLIYFTFLFWSRPWRCHRTCFSGPRIMFWVVAWGTGYASSHLLVASTIVSTWWLPLWVWGGVM